MFSSIRRSWGLLAGRERFTLFTFSTLRVLVNFLDLVGLSLIGFVVALGTNSSLSFSLFGKDLPFDESDVYILLLFTAAAFFLKSGISLILSRQTFLYLSKIETRVSGEIAKNHYTGSLKRLRELSASDIEWTILRSTQKAVTGILGTSIGLLAEVSLAALIFSFLLLADFVLALSVTLYLALILGVFHLVSRNRFKILGEDFATGSVQVSVGIANLNTIFQEVSVLEKTNHFVEKIVQPRQTVARAQAIHDFLGSVPRTIVEIGLILGGLLYFAISLGGNQLSASISTLAMFLVASLRMMSALLPIQRAFQLLKYDTSLAIAAQSFLFEESTDELTANQSGEQETDNYRSQRAARGVGLKLDDVSFSVSMKDSVSAILERISLEIAPGSFAAIIGPSGSGKSTLIQLCLGLNQPSSGAVLLDGVTPNYFRRHHQGLIGFVPQSPGVISGSIRENIALGVPTELVDEEALNSAIEASRLETLIAQLPDGADTLVGVDRISLSGGEVQRLGLARALYSRPGLLVLDEPTSALDGETEQLISSSLEELRGTTTLLVVAHRMTTIQKADQIHVIDQGKLKVSGSFEELRLSGANVYRYVDSLHLD